MTPGLTGTIESVYRSERRRVLATLIRLLGSFDAAEEAMQDALVHAARQWPTEGVPANPYAWLVSTARFQTIDRWRRRARIAAAVPELAALSQGTVEMPDPDAVRDDELRLILICCHPVIPPDARIALALREVAGLTTEEIARAYLTKPVTIAQRIVRAKARIRECRVPYVAPDRTDLAARLESALHVLYLIFNEGYATAAGPKLTRPDLCAEAIRMVRFITELHADSEAIGLLALMLLHDARQATRVDAAGDLILLEEQDRSLWDTRKIEEAQALIDRAFASRAVGPYLLQAAIASVHAAAPQFSLTNWADIVALYDLLFRMEPSAVVALNRAIAIGMRDGPANAVPLLDALLETPGMLSYPPLHAARADFLKKLGRFADSRTAYEQALQLTAQDAEKRFFASRIARLPGSDSHTEP